MGEPVYFGGSASPGHLKAAVRERTSRASNADLLRLYEKWLKTGSTRSGQLLAARRVVPNVSVRLSRIQ
jgi:hypothetical protein